MNDSPKVKVARLDESRGAGGLSRYAGTSGSTRSASTPSRSSEDGMLINDHDEAGWPGGAVRRARGECVLRVDGETFDAPAGTLVSVPPELTRKATGEAPSWPSAARWARRTSRSTGARRGRAQRVDGRYGEQRYGDARTRSAGASSRCPDHRGPQLQLRVLRRAQRRAGDDVYDHLRRRSRGSRRSASRRGGTATWPRCETTLGSRKPFAEREGLAA